MEINKSASGLLYKEEFNNSLSLIWEATNNNRVSLNTDSISLLPGEEECQLLIPTPESYVWNVQTTLVDNGTDNNMGFIVKSITSNIAKCNIEAEQEQDLLLKISMDSFHNLRVRGSKDGISWNDYGNTRFYDCNYFGYYIESDTTSSLAIRSIYVYKSDYVTVVGIPDTCKVQLLDSEETDITSRLTLYQNHSKVIIDTSNMKYPIEKLRINFLNIDDEIEDYFEIEDVYGGDSYETVYDIRFRINNIELDANTFELDTVTGDRGLYGLSIQNNENQTFTSLTLSIQASDGFNLGYIPVSIALAESADDIDNIVFSKTLNIDLLPYENKNFHIKIDRNILPTLDDHYRFKINLK